MTRDDVLEEVARYLESRSPSGIVHASGVRELKSTPPEVPPALADADLAEIEAREKSAKVGPWYAHPYKYDPTACDGITNTPEWTDDGSIVVETDSGNYPPDMATAEFIAHARTDVPRLLAEVRRQRQERDRQVALELPGARIYLVTWERETSSGSFADSSIRVRAYSAADAVTQVEVAERGRLLLGPNDRDSFRRVTAVCPG